MKKLALVTSLATCAAFAAACGAVSNGGSGTPTPINSATPTPTNQQATSIADVNNGLVPPNTSVTLQGVVVTAVDAFGDFYAQDAGGGLFSGMYFFDKNHKAPADLAIGDELTITGTFAPYQGPSSNPWAIAENEIIPDTVSQTNTGLTPTPISIAPADLYNELKDSNGTPANLGYMSALISLSGPVQVTSVGMNYGEYAVGTGTSKMRVDKGLYDSFEPRVVGENLTTLVGVVAYDFDHYHINPRSSADVVGDGSNSPMTISDLNADLLQNTSVKAGQLVTVTGVVSAVDAYTNNSGKTLKNFFIQSAASYASPTDAQYQGIYVEDGRYTNPSVNIGDTVTFTGKYIQYGSTQVAHSVMLFEDHPVGTPSATGATITPLVLPASTMEGTANPKPYEGIFVKVADSSMTVTTAPNSYGEYTVGPGTTKVWIGKNFFDTSSGKTAGANITFAQGPVWLSFGHYYLEPTVAGDVQ